MDKITGCVGLDYHQSFIEVDVLDPAGQALSHFRCANDWRTLAERVSRLGLTAVHAAIESCTGAANLAEELVNLAGWSVDLAHPGFVNRMKQNPDKSDFSDARLLADLVRVGYLPRVWLAPQDIRDLRQVVRYRQQLVAERRNAKLRMGALLRERRVRGSQMRRWTKACLGWLRETTDLNEQGRWIMDRHLARLNALDTEVEEAEKHLRTVTQNHAVFIKLRSLHCVGEVTAWTLLAEIGRFDRFRSSKQLARFCGLSPRNASSGQRQADAGLIKAANAQLRSVLIEAAQRLMRFDPRWSELGQRLMKTGKPRNVAVAAVGNRWVRWLYHEMQPVLAA